MRRSIYISLLLIFCLPGFTFILSPAFAMPSHTLEIIDVPDATKTDVFGINDNGYIVGRYYFEGVRGFLYDGNVFTTIDYPDPPRFDTSVHGINNSNFMVGVYADESGVNHGFTYDGQTFWSIDYPDKSLTRFSGVNELGKIVGYSRDIRNTGFVYSNNEFTDINPPNASESYASDINNQGIIIGNYGIWINLFYRYGFSYDGNEYSTICFPSARHTSAEGNNDNGSVVGYYSDDTGGGIHGFLAIEDNIFSFDIPGAYRTWAYDINNLNQIVGNFTDLEGNGHGFIITLISEPTIDAILGFFDKSVEDETLYGRGTGWLANLRLYMMRNLLVIAGEFIEHDRTEAACFILGRAYKRCDDDFPPRDLVEGPGTELLADMIQDLMESLGCD